MPIAVKLRLPVPEGKPGDVVNVSDERATILVDRRYAEYVGKVTEEEAAGLPPVEPDGEEPVLSAGAQPAPDVELPNHSDLKAEWETVAAQLGIDLKREDGSDKTKDELIAEVEEATG